MNKVFLIGRLTKKPELRYSEANIAVCMFTLAIDREFKNKNGEYDTDFINIKTFNQQAENTFKYVDKGSLVGISGTIQTDSYEKDGKRTYLTNVVADRVQFLDKKEKGISDKQFEEFGKEKESDTR